MASRNPQSPTWAKQPWVGLLPPRYLGSPATGELRLGTPLYRSESNAAREGHSGSERQARQHGLKWQRVAVVTVQSCRKDPCKRDRGTKQRAHRKKRLHEASKNAQSEAPPQRPSHPRLAERLRHHPAISCARSSSAKTSQRGLDKNRRATAKIPRRGAHVRHASHVYNPSWSFRLLRRDTSEALDR